MTPKSVLVTGATTPLGAALCLELQRRGTSVLAVGAEACDLARGTLDAKIEYQCVDLRRPRDLHDLVFGEAVKRRIDTVVHLAMHRRPERESAAIHALNVEALRHLLIHCEAHPTVKRVVVRSSADVYRVDYALPTFVSETHPLSFASGAPQWVRDRVEADALVCGRMGMGKIEIILLRFAELFVACSGSQIYDYLSSRVCLRPLGFDPMINLLSLQDAVRALWLGASAAVRNGVFNIRGADTLPLSAAIAVLERQGLPLPGPLLKPLYGLRHLLRGNEFSYALSGARLHYPALLDGREAARVLGYEPAIGAL